MLQARSVADVAGVDAENMSETVNENNSSGWKDIAITFPQYINACYKLRSDWQRGPSRVLCKVGRLKTDSESKDQLLGGRAPARLCTSPCAILPTFTPEKLCGLNITTQVHLHGAWILEKCSW